MNLSLKEVRLADETCDKRRSRLLVNACGGSLLLDISLVHDDDVVGHRQGFFLVVRYKDRGHSDLALKVSNLEPHSLAQFCVERGEWFIEQKDFRANDDRTSKRDTLLLPAGQFAREAVAKLAEVDKF